MTAPLTQPTPPYQQGLLWFTAIMLSVVLALLTYLQPGSSLEPGLDSSWAYGVNYTFQHRLLLGKDIYFTFGPLGFLEHTRALTLDMLDFSSHFWLLCSIALNLLLLCLCYFAAPTRWHLLANLVLGIGLLLFANTVIQRLMLLSYAGVLLHWLHNRPGWLVPVSMACVLAMLVKFSNGAAVLALYLPYLAIITLRDRDWRQAATGLGGILFGYLLIWWLVYGRLEGSLGYLQGGLQFSRGSTTAMALNPANNWPAIGAFYLAFLAGLAVLAGELRSGWALMPLCFLGPLFVWSKYAFGREDGPHLGFLMAFVFFVCPLWAIAAHNWLRKCLCLLVIPLCFLSWQRMHSAQTGPTDFSPRLSYYPQRAKNIGWQHDELKQIMDTLSATQLAPLQMPAVLRELIGDSTVDIYPWETLIAAANQLNWTPRPVYQNYISYTPFLDSANQRFYDSDKAPAFIVWHYHSFADIGSRYPFSSDPLTLQAILQHYRLVRCKQEFCVWQHTTDNLLTVMQQDQPTTTAWDNWIPLPPATKQDVLRLHVDVVRTLVGKLNLALWKEGGIEIDYRLRDGSIRTHEVVLDNAVSGLWVSPYIESFYSRNRPRPVDTAQWQRWLEAPPAEGYVEKAELAANGIRIYGWGLLPFKTSANQHLSLLLHNDNHTYRIPVQNRPRPGITDHFGKQGIVDLDSCGFDETFSAADIAPGAYQIRFVIENEGELALSPLQPATLSVPDNLNPHNVEAVRLRSTRPWTFTDSVAIHWTTLHFTGEHPW